MGQPRPRTSGFSLLSRGRSAFGLRLSLVARKPGHLAIGETRELPGLSAVRVQGPLQDSTWRGGGRVEIARRTPDRTHFSRPFQPRWGSTIGSTTGMLCWAAGRPSYPQSYSLLESVPASTGEYDWEYDGESRSTTDCRSRRAKRALGMGANRRYPTGSGVAGPESGSRVEGPLWV